MNYPDSIDKFVQIVKLREKKFCDRTDLTFVLKLFIVPV